MSNIKAITVDELGLRQTVYSITEQSEGFKADLKSLFACVEEMSGFWSGTAAKAYAANLSSDFKQLGMISAIFSELADNYRFALNEYEKNTRRTMDVVSALKI